MCTISVIIYLIPLKTFMVNNFQKVHIQILKIDKQQTKSCIKLNNFKNNRFNGRLI